MRDELGSNWREKLPVPADHEVVMKGQHSTMPSVVPSQHQASHGTAVTSAGVKPSAELSKEQQLKKYEELKEKGNAYVKKVRFVCIVGGIFRGLL